MVRLNKSPICVKISDKDCGYLEPQKWTNLYILLVRLLFLSIKRTSLDHGEASPKWPTSTSTISRLRRRSVEAIKLHSETISASLTTFPKRLWKMLCSTMCMMMLWLIGTTHQRNGLMSPIVETLSALDPGTSSLTSNVPCSREVLKWITPALTSRSFLKTRVAAHSTIAQSAKNGTDTSVMTTGSSLSCCSSHLMVTPGIDQSSQSRSRVRKVATPSFSTLPWITSGMDSTQDSSVCLASLPSSKVVTIILSPILELLLVKCATSLMETEVELSLASPTPMLELMAFIWMATSSKSPSGTISLAAMSLYPREGAERTASLVFKTSWSSTCNPDVRSKSNPKTLSRVRYVSTGLWMSSIVKEELLSLLTELPQCLESTPAQSKWSQSTRVPLSLISSSRLQRMMMTLTKHSRR